VAGAATMTELTPNVYRRLAELTEMLRQGVRMVCSELEQPVLVTGIGSLFGIHFTEQPIRNYRDIAASDKSLAERMFMGMLNEGFLLAPNLVGALSMALGEMEVDAFVRALRRVLTRQR
jgi:glutamate-1-semialdehyde 2,1-aminomutase